MKREQSIGSKVKKEEKEIGEGGKEREREEESAKET